MKTLIIALFITTQAMAAIPLNSDDERSISNPTLALKQERIIERITENINIALIEYGQLKTAEEDLNEYISALAIEIKNLNNYRGSDLDIEYLNELEEDIQLLRDGIALMD